VAPEVVEYVFIDTQVFVAMGFGYGSTTFHALRKHLEIKRLRLVLTDITVNEVHAKIEQHVSQELVEHRKFVKSARVLFNSSIPGVRGALQKFDAAVVTRDLRDQFDAFLAESHALIIPTSDIKAGDVLRKYFAVTPPFGAAENKRREFPDAFAIEALIEWAYESERTLFVVTADELFRAACQKFPLIPKVSLRDVLDHVASDDEQFAARIRRLTMDRISDVTKAAEEGFEERFYWVDDYDGDAEVHVTELVADSEPLIIEIGPESATLQLGMTATYSADLSYIDSSSSIYSEGELVYADRKEETVEREQELTVEILVTYDQRDLETFEIENIIVTEPSDGFGIKTEDDHDWPHK
jgi:hypothetical protein